RAEANRALRPGHRLRLLKGGEALFPALVEAIDGARAEVMLETYIFEFVGAAIAVAEALERAAGRGVVVRVVVDGIGTGEIPAEWRRRWQAAGVRWRVFNPTRGSAFAAASTSSTTASIRRAARSPSRASTSRCASPGRSSTTPTRR